MPLTANSIQLGPWKRVRYDIPVEDCAPDELSAMENVRIGQGGEISQRKGTTSYKSLAALGSTPTLTFTEQFNSDADTEHTVIVAGAAIYHYASSVWTDITDTTTITAGDDNTFEGANCNGTLVITNGVNTDAIKWTGTGNASVLDDNGRFSKAKHCAWFDNRLWMGNVNGATNQVWHSDVADIETWGATSFFNFGGIVTGLVPTQNALTVHTTDGIYTLIPTGDATTPYRPNKQTAKAGIDGRSCVALPGDVQLMVLEDGVYEWSGGAELEKISGHLDTGYWDNLNTDRLHKAFALYHPRENEVWFALPYGGAQTAMNHIMVYNRKSRGWHGPYKGWTRNCAALIDEKPHFGGFDGVLYDHEATNNDDSGTSIASSAETAAPAPFDPDVRVRFLNARTYFDAVGDYSLTIEQLGAELAGSIESIDMSGVGFDLDADQLDVDALTNSGQLAADTPLQGYEPQCSLRYSMNSAGQTWTVRKAFIRHKTLGRYWKGKPSDG